MGFFFFQKRSCFFCRVTLARIKKICGGGIFFIFGERVLVWYVLQKQNSPCTDLTWNGQNKNFEANNYVKVEPILDFFFFQKRSCFFCRVTLALIKKICGGGIFFIFWKESTLFDMSYKNKTRLAQILLATAKTRILKPTIV